jgi:hypothetical protein
MEKVLNLLNTVRSNTDRTNQLKPMQRAKINQNGKKISMETQNHIAIDKIE